MTDQERAKLLNAVIARLMEHFETVQITATFANKDGDYVGANAGSGNFYARVGSVDEWLMQVKKEMKGPETIVVRQEDDGSDDWKKGLPEKTGV